MISSISYTPYFFISLSRFSFIAPCLTSSSELGPPSFPMKGHTGMLIFFFFYLSRRGHLSSLSLEKKEELERRQSSSHAGCAHPVLSTYLDVCIWHTEMKEEKMLLGAVWLKALVVRLWRESQESAVDRFYASFFKNGTKTTKEQQPAFAVLEGVSSYNCCILSWEPFFFFLFVFFFFFSSPRKMKTADIFTLRSSWFTIVRKNQSVCLRSGCDIVLPGNLTISWAGRGRNSRTGFRCYYLLGVSQKKKRKYM